MANNVTLDAIVKGKKDAQKVGLKITSGSETFVLSDGGLTKFAEKTETRIPVTGDKAEAIMDDVLLQLKKGEKLPENVRKHFSAIVGHIEKHHTGAVKGSLESLTEKVTALGKLKDAKTVEVAEKLLTENPELKHVMSDDLEKHLVNDLKLDMTKVDKLIRENAAKLAKLEKAGESLTTLLKAEKLDHKAISRLLQDNAHQLDKIEAHVSADAIENASKKGLTLSDHLTKIKGEFDGVSKEAYGLMEKEAEQLRIIEHAGKDSAAAKAAKEAAEGFKKDYTKLLEGEYGAAIRAGAPTELAEKVARFNPSLGKSLGAEAAAGAKDGFKFRNLLMKSDSVEKGLTGLKAVHWGKAVGWAAALGVVGYIAGIGRNREQTKYTDAAVAQQGQQQGMSVA